jgi:2-hydroxychromene-2-carboxylate isomerase
VSLKQRIKGLAIEAYLSTPVKKAKGRLHRAKRNLQSAPRRVELFYQVGCPYSHLLAQAMPGLMDTYGVDVEFHLIEPPAPDVDPEPSLRAKYGPRDCRELARYYQVEFPDGPDLVDSKAVGHGNAILIVKRPVREQIQVAIEVGEQLWSGKRELHELAGKYGREASGSVAPVLANGYARLRKVGHYMGGVLAFDGELYWGIDRLHYLEERLAEEDGREVEHVVPRRPEPLGEPELIEEEDGKVVLEYWHSFRSPYSYLALERTFEVADRHGVELRLKPVLPMVMRGMPVPRIKTMYIVKDAKREADRLGIPFGRICDPVGKGIHRCLAVFGAAKEHGLEREVTLSIGRGIWSEALDPLDMNDMRTMVERAGLDWEIAREAVNDESWRDWAVANRDELLGAGLWGVPCFRLGSYSTWGQDRIEMLDHRLAQHAIAKANAPEEANEAP